jgi:8-oxo-dGTP pyrophosphatase MutT (NUDIX family)
MKTILRKKMRNIHATNTMQAVSSAIKQAGQESKESVTVIVMAGDSILMGQRRDNLLWTFPGGHKRQNENDYQAAVRELYEEAGIQVDKLDKIGSKLNDQGHLVHIYKCELTTGSPGNRDITNKYDPDQEIKLWKWLRVGSPEFNYTLKVLHHPKNFALQALGIT